MVVRVHEAGKHHLAGHVEDHVSVGRQIVGRSYLLDEPVSDKQTPTGDLPPFIVHGTHRLDESAIAEHAAQYRRVVEALRDGRVDFDLARRYARLNAGLSEIIRD